MVVKKDSASAILSPGSHGALSSSAPSPSVRMPHPRNSSVAVTASGRGLHSYLSTTMEESEGDDEHAALAAIGTGSAPQSSPKQDAHIPARQPSPDAEPDPEPDLSWEAEDEAAAAIAAEELRREEELDRSRERTAVSKTDSQKGKSLPSATGMPHSTTSLPPIEPSASPPADASQEDEPNATGGRSWRLVVAAELIGHTAAVSALFVPGDRASVWSGDVAGQVIAWAVPDGGVGSAAASGASSGAAGLITSPSYGLTSVASNVACHCKQSAQHKSSWVS